MKHRITVDSMAHEFRLLRNRIEAEVNAPAIVVVTSATDGDGAGLTAYSLAESLAKSKQRTILVTSSTVTPVATLHGDPEMPRRRRSTDRIEGQAHPGGDERLSIITISQERVATISRTAVDSLVQELRAEHAYIVVDAGNLPKNSFGLLMMASADAALVAFRSGRSQQPGDRIMLDILERSESKVLGVVMTDEVAIDHFAHPDAAATVSEVPAVRRKPAEVLAERFQLVRERLGKAI